MVVNSQSAMNSLYRWTAAVAGLAILLLGPWLQQMVPDLRDPPVARYLVCAACFGYLTLSFTSKWFLHYLQPLLIGLVYLISGWLVWLNYLNSFHPALAYAVFEMIAGASIAFSSLRGLGIYLGLHLGFVALAVQLSHGIMVQKGMYVPSVAVVAVLVFIVHCWRTYLQSQLESSAVLMESIFQRSADGLVLYRNNEPSMFNQPALALLKAEDQAAASSLLALLGSDLGKYRDTPRDTEVLRANDEPVWCELVLTQVDRRQNLDLLRLTDISARKRQEQELTAALATTERALTARQDFLATVSHELRTPLNGIIGASRLLADELQSASQAGQPQELLGLVQQSGDSLLATIDNMIDFSEAGNDQESVRSEPLSLTECVRSIALRHEPQALAKQLAFTLETNLDLGLATTKTRIGDAHRLRRALDILVENAIKFTDAGHIILRVQASGPEVSFYVEDSGIGIEPEAQERIFAGFTQAQSSLNRRFGGLGLGLALCQRIVALMGGTLSLSSEPGSGSQFSFTLNLPIAESPSLPNAGQAIGQEIVDPSAVVDRRVLLAEDNQVNQVITLKMLQKLGYAADLAEDGLEVLAACARENYALILMDVQMPNMGGLEATQALRKQGSTEAIPIIALTANAADSDRARCLAAGMNDFLPKPVDLITLKDRIDRFIAA